MRLIKTTEPADALPADSRSNDGLRCTVAIYRRARRENEAA